MADASIWFYQSPGSDHQRPSLPTGIQQYIKEAFWPHSNSSIAEYDSYFKYFRWTISVLSWHHQHNGIHDREHFAAQTYADLAKIVRRLRLSSDGSRVVIAQQLQEDFPAFGKAQILRSVDLTVRLWLTIHLRSDDHPIGPALSDVTETCWLEGTSLRTMINDIFPPNLYSMQTSNVQIQNSFTAKDLRKLCRLRIQWTANLRDHLLLDRASATLRLFPHKICMISHLETCDVLPKDLAAETIRTLDLLFPFGEESTQDFLDETGQTFYRTSFRDQARPTHLGEFRYWRKRLVELNDVYNEAPRSVLQMWHDRRNPMQWWTFWLAAAIAVMSVIFGAMSSYTGFKQVTLAQKSYDLALSQACAQTNRSEFCRS